MREISPKFTKNEAIWLGIVTLTVLVITSIPYVFGYLSAPPDLQFMGIAYGTPDTTQYLTWMRGFGESFFIENQMTAELTEPVYFNLLWWFLGQISAKTGWDLLLVFQIFRIGTIITFVPLAYWIFSLFLEGLRERWLGFLLVVFGAGLGWMLVVDKHFISGDLRWPFDLYTVEPNSFLAMIAFPHFLNAASFIILIFVLTLFAFERRRIHFAIAAGLLGLVLGFIHAYDLLLIYAVIGAFAIIVGLREGRWREAILNTGAIGFLSCPGAFYSFYITHAFPTWREVLAQFVNAGAWTPSPAHLPILLGLPFLLAVGILLIDRPVIAPEHRKLFIKVWFIVQLLMIYFPVNYQIHYLNGLQFPIAIIAASGFYLRLLPWLREKLPGLGSSFSRRGAILPALFLLIAIPTNLYLLLWRVHDLNRHSYPYYLFRDEVDALEWLREDGVRGGVVLSSVEVGQYIPSHTDNRAFLAHWAMTLDLYTKRRFVQDFYDPSWPDDERRQFLEEYQIQYVIWGESERMIGSLDPSKLSYLIEIYSGSHTKLYEVRLDAPGSGG